MTKFDAIVIGGGVNSLVTAAVLGKAGKKVLVLEARDELGGVSSTVEFAPGFKCNLINDVVKWIDPRITEKLELKNHGLELIRPEVVRVALGDNGEHIAFHCNPNETATSISNHSKRDAKVWKEFTEYVRKLANILEKLYTLTPPNLPNVGLKEALGMRSLLRPITQHGTRGLVDLARVVPMMMPELVDEWFENELLRAAVATAGIHHLSFGPFAAGTGYNLLHQHVHSGGIFHNAQFIKGGTNELANVLKSSAESVNVEFRTNTIVDAINVKDGICNGLTFNDGKILEAKNVISGLDPNNTFINLIGSSNLNPNFHTQLNNIRYRGSTARIHFALNSIPEINGTSVNQMGTVFSIAPSIEYLEQASDAVKYGQLSTNPYVEFTIPSVINSDFAPEGKHVLSATIQYAPYYLRGQQWSSELNDQLKYNVTGVLEKYLPNFSSLIESSHILSPSDLETQFGLTEGNLNHGEMTLDQFMFMRPTITTAQYKTPIKNLYLCGSGTHPGGGLHGTNGLNAAQVLLK